MRCVNRPVPEMRPLQACAAQEIHSAAGSNVVLLPPSGIEQ